MPELSRTFQVAQTLSRTATYVSDLRTSPDWDPHTRRCRQLDDGPVRVGMRYDLVRHLLGFDSELECEVVEYEPESSIRLHAHNAMMDTDELMQFRADGPDRTEITWTVHVELHGPAKHGQALVPAVLQSVADDGTAGLRARLEAMR